MGASFVVHVFGIMKQVVGRKALDKGQVYFLFQQRILYLFGISAYETYFYGRIIVVKTGYHFRQHVLGYGRRCSKPQLAFVFFLEARYAVIYLAVYGIYVFGLFVEYLACLGQHGTAAFALEKGDAVNAFQFLYVLGYGRLGYVVFVRRLGETHLRGYGIKHFKSEIEHFIYTFLFYMQHSAAGIAR